MEIRESNGRTHSGKQAVFIRESLDDAESLHVIGEVDLANEREFESSILSMSQLERPMVIDLTSCTYIDSRGLYILERTNARFSFRVVAAANSSAQRIFEVIKASEFLSIEYKVVPTIKPHHSLTPHLLNSRCNSATVQET